MTLILTDRYNPTIDGESDMAPSYAERIEAWHAKHLQDPKAYGRSCETFARWQSNPIEYIRTKDGGYWRRYNSNGKGATE